MSTVKHIRAWRNSTAQEWGKRRLSATTVEIFWSFIKAKVFAFVVRNGPSIVSVMSFHESDMVHQQAGNKHLRIQKKSRASKVFKLTILYVSRFADFKQRFEVPVEAWELLSEKMFFFLGAMSITLDPLITETDVPSWAMCRPTQPPA